ncbi:MAG: hypothetical protein K0S65_2178 [Labilithrix sp.]|nr:hypothetical protein [Labilithrix sp.]
MGQERVCDLLAQDIESTEDAPASRRHRPASEIRFAKPTPAVEFDPLSLPGRGGVAGRLTDEIRVALWELVHAALFAPDEASTYQAAGRWALPPTSSVIERPAVRRVWVSSPLGGDLDRIPEDVVEVLEGWISLVEPADVYRFIEAVHDALDAPLQPRFAAAVNVALERGHVDHRFVFRHLLPIASKADVGAIERSLAACKSAGWTDVAEHMHDALERLGEKPDADVRGAIHAAFRAVQRAALGLTSERYFDLEDALDDLEARGHVGRPLKTAYAGLFTYVTSAHRATTDDGRLILVMCAGFVSHLASRLG